ncbi:MAG: PQQ-like beta-propeller repeat protein [Phycisphaeraceae bacterium]|nr:PQQ-like beta-propeller repeat protein [Phycisphaeraceae bacterium]
MAAGRDWPNYLGANGGHAAAPSGHELVEDFRDARLVWKSEFTPPGRNQTTRYGEGNIIRYRARSWAGGEASPVVADGRVYLYYFDPAGERMLDYVDESIEVGRAVVRKQWHARADDVFLCVDAETGQTLWKKRFPLAGHNSFAAKGSYTHTPAVDDGILIGRGSAGITYAFEAETGRLLWRGGIGGGHAGIIIDGVYFSPAGGGIDVPLTAVDARTGKELWRIAGTVGHQSIPVRWSHGGEHYVIAGNSAGKVYCVHARSGEVLWTASGLGANIHNLYVDGDHLVANAAPRGEAPQPAGYRITPDGLEHLWTLSAERIEHDPRRTQPVIANGHAWLRCDGRPSRLIVVEMETGRITADVSGPVGEFLYFMDGMIIADQDVSHSNTNLRMIIADPNQPRSEQDGFTSARHRQTSGYWPHPFRHALFDGRIVIRGARGLYCYDLRKPAAE